MPPAAGTHTNSPRPSSPANAHDTDGAEDQATVAGVWKRRYLVLQETVNAQNSSKRKEKTKTSTEHLGRGIRKVIFICGEIKNLVSDSDKHCAYLEDPDDLDLNNEFDGLDNDEVQDLKRDWERSHTAVRELNHLIPNFQKIIDEGSPEDLNDFYARLERGANGARSDDLNRIRGSISDWLNETNPTPSPLLDHNCRKNRGLGHDATGKLLCPVEFGWDNLVTRAKLRAYDENFDWLSSYHSTCFYANYKADATQLESGYLKSTLLVKVYKCIFTSPSSAGNVSEEEDATENMPPAKSQKTAPRSKPGRRNVASKLHLNSKVTARSIAYAAVQLHFNLQTAGSWAASYGGFDYQGLYNYIVDVFEDAPGPVAKKRAQDLLNWWSKWVFSLLAENIQFNSDDRKIFPDSSLHRQANTSASRKAFKQQRAALEHHGEEALERHDEENA